MKGIKRTEFENGLVLLTEKRPHAQKAVMLVGVKVGSINEDDKLNGASHYNEHLLFKSNKYRTAKQITEDLEFEGTSVNAFTDHTITAFYAKTLPEKLTKAVDVVYQAATNFEYNEEEFSRERGVILTEIRLNIEQPTRYSMENLFVPTLFEGTPLERIDSRAIEILETECDKLPYDFREIPRYLDKITKEDLLEMAQKYLTDQYVLTALVPEGFQRK